MTDKPPEAVKLPRRAIWYHPLVFLLLAAVWPPIVGAYVWAYLFLLNVSGLGRLPGVNPMIAVIIGLLGGSSVLLYEKRRLRRHLEDEARAIAFREQRWRRAIVPILFFLAVFGATVGLFGLAAGGHPAILLPLTQASFFLPLMFLHRHCSRVYQRAQALLAEAAGVQAEASRDQARWERIARWADGVGVVAVSGLLVLGAWLQWGVPWMAQREPRHFETKTDDTHGVATRLTYGNDASAPAVSPDGRLVAYAKRVFGFDQRLEIMRRDGREKRHLAKRFAVSPAGLSVAWSPDGKRILLVGDEVPTTISWTGLYAEGNSWRSDLWVVDAAGGDLCRLTKDDGYLAGMWLPATHRIAAIRSTTHKWARLWLMDERGGSRLKVAELKLRRHSLAAQPWHDGHDVVAVGAEDTAGIWLVDAANGKVTRLSDIAASWALPIAPQWLVIGVKGHAYPPFHRATSVGLCDTGTGKVHWALRDIQGTVGHPCVVPKLGVIVFSLRLDEGRDVWALRLRDGQLRRLTRGESVMNATVDALGKTIFYQASNEECERFRGFNIGESIWRLDLGRPLAAARWDVWP